MSDEIAKTMIDLLKSDKYKTLFGKTASDHTDENNGPNLDLFDKEMEDPEGMKEKYPNAFKILDLLDLESKFPHLGLVLNRVAKGDFDDSHADDNNADDGLAATEAAQVMALLDGLDNPELSAEFSNMLRDMGINPDDTITVEEGDDLVVSDADEYFKDNAPEVLEHGEELGFSYSAANLAIDSLIVASAALDKLNLFRSASLSLEMASMIVEAKKKVKKDEEEKKDKKSKKDDDKEDKKSKSKKSKKDDKEDDKEDKKSKKSKKSKKMEKDEDGKDSKKSKK